MTLFKFYCVYIQSFTFQLKNTKALVSWKWYSDSNWIDDKNFKKKLLYDYPSYHLITLAPQIFTKLKHIILSLCAEVFIVIIISIIAVVVLVPLYCYSCCIIWVFSLHHQHASASSSSSFLLLLLLLTSICSYSSIFIFVLTLVQQRTILHLFKTHSKYVNIEQLSQKPRK